MRLGWRIDRAAAVGERIDEAFVTRRDGTCGLTQVTQSVYPRTAFGDRLRVARRRAGLGLGDAADRLGLRPSEISGLEYGRLVLAEDQQAELLGALEVAW